jgi:3-hydroxyisobutyrate dehydrogenase
LKTGFIGLGTMGSPMARCLEQAGFSLCVFDTDIGQRSEFTCATESIEQLAHECSRFFTMLPQAAEVTQVIQSITANLKHDNCLFVDCSTIDVASTRTLAIQLLSSGHHFVDAPVSGGREAAEKGALSFMIGGTAEAVHLAQPFLEVMGSKWVEFGEAGAGQAAKACHNMICGITALGVCEAFALADALDLDPDKFFQLCRGAGPAPDAPASNDYAPGFAARLMAKDLALAQQAADASGQETEFGALAAQRFNEFVETADGDLDFSSIYRSIRK